MKGMIIYKGKYGATRQYADWLSEELGLIAAPADDILKEQLDGYNFFLIGSSVYIGKLQISEWLKKNLALLSGKKIFFFQVAATSPSETDKLKKYITAGVPPEIRNKMQVYFLPGRMKMKSLSWKDRFLLKMGARLVKDRAEKKKMLSDFDHVKKEHLEELLNTVRTYCFPIAPLRVHSSVPV